MVGAAKPCEHIVECTANEGLRLIGPDAVHRCVRRAPVDHVAGAGIGAMRVCPIGLDDDVRKPVAVEVTGRRDGEAGLVACGDTIEPIAVCAVQRAEVQDGGKAAGAAKHHIGRSGILPVRAGSVGAYDQVVVAVPIHVSSIRHREAGPVAGAGAVDAEAVGSVQAAQIDRGAEASGVAENHIRRSVRPGAAVAMRAASRRTDDQVGIAVAIEVARSHGLADAPCRLDSSQGEAVAAVEVRQIDIGRKPAVRAEDHVGHAGVGLAGWRCADRSGVWRPDDHVCIAVAVDIAS